MSLCVLLCTLKNGTSWRKWLCLFCCCLFLGGFRVVQVIRKDFTWCSLTVYQVESNQQLRTDQSQVNQQVSHWLKSLTVFLVCVTEDKMRQDFLFYHLFIELILVVFVLMYFYMCLCVTAWTKKSEESESSVSYQPHDFFTLFMYTWICAGEPRSTQYWSEYNPSTLWVTKLWKQTIPAVSKKTDYLKNGEKQENRLFTVYSAATATGLQKWGVSQPSKELVVFSPPSWFISYNKL